MMDKESVNRNGQSGHVLYMVKSHVSEPLRSEWGFLDIMVAAGATMICIEVGHHYLHTVLMGSGRLRHEIRRGKPGSVP